MFKKAINAVICFFGDCVNFVAHCAIVEAILGSDE